jgi:hypothetical protein
LMLAFRATLSWSSSGWSEWCRTKQNDAIEFLCVCIDRLFCVSSFIS